jgi:Tfp pilus assembly protein PilF
MNERSSHSLLRGVRALTFSFLLLPAFGACGSSTPPAEEPPPPLEGDHPPAKEQTAPASSAKVQQGMDLIQNGDFQGAQAVLKAAHEENPKDAQAAFYLGVTYAELKDAPHAIELFRKALELDPKLTEASVNLSALLLDQKDGAGALSVVEAGLKVNPKHPGLLMNRALALEATGSKDALQAYATAVAAQPDNADLHFGYAGMLAASGKNDKAIEELKSVIQSADDPLLLAAAANALGKLKAFADCVAALDKAIKAKPSADFHVRRGACRHGLDDDAGAKSDYDAAIGIDPKYAPAYYYLGMHYRAAKKTKEATQNLQKAVELGAGTPVAEAAKKALAEMKKK